MKVKINVFLMLLVCSFLSLKAQTNSETPADKKYEKLAYVDAISIYEKLASKGYKSQEMFQKLGNAHYFNGQLLDANKAYNQLFEMNPNQEAEYLYRYSQCLKAGGNYQKADSVLVQFRQQFDQDSRGFKVKENTNYLREIKANSGRYQIADAGINSDYSDFGAAFYQDKLVFASTRDTGGVAKKTFKWTNGSFSNLYQVDLLADGSIGKPERFKKEINSKFNESTPVFSKDGTTIYFTRNNYVAGKKGKSSEQTTLLKIYKATWLNEQWTNITALPFNSEQYSVAHPALSPDEKYLYFASDMPGTKGQSDIFRVAIFDDGDFGQPENLGSEINTEGRETFPFVSSDNELYFATDGRPGLGGLDVFVSKIMGNSTFATPQNLGEPINSPQDDFAYIINGENRNGFFSSNRNNASGYDDIYRFTETQKLQCSQVLVGKITDSETNELLLNAQVQLFDQNHLLIAETVSNGKGVYTFSNLDCKTNYFVMVQKTDYETVEKVVTTEKYSGMTAFDISLAKNRKPVMVGTDLAKTLHIPIIYFELDKFNINKEAAYDLEKVLAVLQDNPTMKIDIRSHTDSRQTKKYNLILSEKRAQATKKWLVQNGIDPTRLTAKGYGESQLVNQCGDGVKCSEKEHKQNRRSEFIITSL
ncbi:OmpA family protein [Flavobacterium agrisoli]|uniref:OmpA family protein n=1 Tax=Flavobacterium agrisoli TaxID=2793066 RepID=A0A934PNY7_9FLAO|nr:OmpA family protein [Flavobacterium agrisoli]MBK0370249.1 OmpA family protein [Flavobacterium agrisoli]